MPSKKTLGPEDAGGQKMPKKDPGSERLPQLKKSGRTKEVAKAPISTERLDDFLGETSRHVSLFKSRISTWVKQAEELALRLGGGEQAWELSGLFLIRLSGILFDLWDSYRITEEQILEMQQDPEEHRWQMYIDLAEALEALRDLFEDDELLYIEFHRNLQSHPILRGYMPRANEGDHWNHKTSKMLGGTKFELEELIDRCSAVESRLGGQHETCRDFAKRSWKVIGSIGLRLMPVLV